MDQVTVDRIVDLLVLLTRALSYEHARNAIGDGGTPPERLRLAMQRRGLRQIEVAKAANENPENVSRWLTGRSVPRADSAVRLCRAIGVRVEDIWGEGESEAT